VYTAADGVTAALLIALIVLLGAIALRSWRRSQISPEEKERRRRLMLLVRGKMGDASLLEINNDLVIYSYDVGGVEYTASQDISHLRQFLPDEDASIIGHILVRYDPRNPANSIVIAEEWSGLRSANSHRKIGP
jgi:hypothetical protein